MIQQQRLLSWSHALLGGPIILLGSTPRSCCFWQCKQPASWADLLPISSQFKTSSINQYYNWCLLSSSCCVDSFLCNALLLFFLHSADCMPVCYNKTEHCCRQESCHSEPLMLLRLPAKWQDSASPRQVVVGNLVILDPWCCCFIKLNGRIPQLHLRLRMAYIARRSFVMFNVVWLLDLLWTSHKRATVCLGDTSKF